MFGPRLGLRLGPRLGLELVRIVHDLASARNHRLAFLPEGSGSGSQALTLTLTLTLILILILTLTLIPILTLNIFVAARYRKEWIPKPLLDVSKCN